MVAGSNQPAFNHHTVATIAAKPTNNTASHLPVITIHRQGQPTTTELAKI
jgi:hypothetical protein